MTRVLRDERGMALAVAIFALVVAGALIAGAFFAGTQEQRVGQNSLRVQQSFGVGEAAINEVVRNWQPLVYNALKVYPADSFVFTPTVTGGGTGSYTGVVRKLNNNLFLVDVTGRDRASAAGATYGAGARQRLGWLMRVRLLDIGIGGALTTQGSVKLAGNAYVDGHDFIPSGWTTANCDTVGDTTKAGVRAPDSAVVQTGGGPHLGGNPPFLKDSSVHPSTFTVFGDVTYDEIAALASVQLPGGTYKTQPTVSGGVCDRSVGTNWGDGMNPAAACGSYFPIVHISGDATLNETLIAAGIDKAKALIACSDSDVANVYITLSARSLNPALFIVARASLRDTEKKLLIAGANRVMSPYFIAGKRMAALATRPVITDFLDLVSHGGQLEFNLHEISISSESPLVSLPGQCRSAI